MNKIINHKDISFYKWIWHSYVTTALIPLIIVELIFTSIYFLSNTWSQKEIGANLKIQTQKELAQISRQETDLINQKLSCITDSTIYMGNEIGQALSTPATLNTLDYNRLIHSENGTYVTRENNTENIASVFYSNLSSTKEQRQDKIARILTVQKLMSYIKSTQPLVSRIYFNSFDSLNVIYPYEDMNNHLTDIQPFNFYYEADSIHNPEKKVKFTDVYLDETNRDLMTSAIYPVYNNNFLEGVAGISFNLNTIADQISSIDIPFNGYSLLIRENGDCLTTSDDIKNDLELSADNQNQLNLYSNSDLALLKDNVRNNVNGFANLAIKGRSNLVYWDTVSNTDWKLLIFVPGDQIYSETNTLQHNLIQIGIIVLLGLVISYWLFFIILSRKAKKMSYVIASSLLEINSIVQRISDGNYNPESPVLNIKELRDISVQILKMGEHLGEINKNLLSTQSELEEKEIDLKALVNSINDIILEVDSNGFITNLWSRAYRDLHQVYELGYLNSISDLLDKETSKIAIEKISHVIETQETETLEFNIESNSGLIWLQAFASPRLNDANKVVVSARDVTDQKKMARSIIAAKEEAEKASKAKSEFLSSMSHELRTPLNAILGFSQILELDSESPLTESQSESVKEILKAGNHLLELINEVLDLAKIESGKLSISIESVPIKPVMEETLAIIKPFAAQYNIKIIAYPILNSNEFVSADHTRLKQILLNLLSNAIKYNKQNGQVIFYHDRLGDKYRFHVIDTGIGLSDSDLNLIYKPFQRLNKINNAIEGTGIGLTVAKQLVELMNGEIHVTSEKDIGSHFWVEFPYVDSSDLQDSENAIHAENQSSLAEAKGYIVLYAEDNPANLKLVERILSRINHLKMLSATSGELCIDLAIAHKPDLILLDINLPGMDGYEVLKKLKMYKDTRDIPVIAISAQAMPRDIEKGLNLGFTNYITKPIDIQNFIEVITSILMNNESKDGN